MPRSIFQRVLAGAVLLYVSSSTAFAHQFHFSQGAVLLSYAVPDDTEWNDFIRTGDAAMQRNQFAEAEKSYRDSLSFAEKHWKDDARISLSLFKVAESLKAQSTLQEANVYAYRAVVSMDGALKAHKPKEASEELQQVEVSATFFDKLGDFFASTQDFLDAEEMYGRTKSIREEYVATNLPTKATNKDFFRAIAQAASDAEVRVADANDKLADLFSREKKFADAESLYKESEGVREKKFGPDSVQVAKSLNDLAFCYSQQGQYDKAEPLFKRVINILQGSEYRDSLPLATALENYALLLKKIGRDNEAQPLLGRALSIRAKSTSP